MSNRYTKTHKALMKVMSEGQKVLSNNDLVFLLASGMAILLGPQGELRAVDIIGKVYEGAHGHGSSDTGGNAETDPPS